MKSMLLAGTVAGVGSTYWVSASQRRSARMVRALLADTQRKISPAALKPRPELWSDRHITLAWLGHSSVLINFYGMHILTDPVFSRRVGIGFGIGTLGPKRYVITALRAQELPPIDLVLLSHAHYDHLDIPSLKHFPASTFMVTAKNTRVLLPGKRLEPVVELGWNERTRFKCSKGDVEIQAFEVRHWGKRWPSEVVRGYNGYLLRREGKTILFGGDTAHTPLFSALRSQGPFAVGIMPIGAYRPWIRSHCTPEEALAMANAAGAQYLLPVHHETFRLSEEPLTEPMERLIHALRHEPDRLALRQIGGTFVCPGA